MTHQTPCICDLSVNSVLFILSLKFRGLQDIYFTGNADAVFGAKLPQPTSIILFYIKDMDIPWGY